MPRIIVIGGPNGAGKTTTAMTLLPELTSCGEFVNADMLARGLSPLDPQKSAIEAGRIMLERIRTLVAEKASFSIETTLASRSFVGLLKGAKQQGYEIEILYVWLKNVTMALNRVTQRVGEGGHSISADVVRRRYQRSRENFLTAYMPLADRWAVCDNSGEGRVAVAAKNGPLVIHDEGLWRAFAGEPK